MRDLRAKFRLCCFRDQWRLHGVELVESRTCLRLHAHLLLPRRAADAVDRGAEVDYVVVADKFRVLVARVPYVDAPMLQWDEMLIRSALARLQRALPYRLEVLVQTALLHVGLGLLLCGVLFRVAVLLSPHLVVPLGVEIFLDLEDNLVDWVARRGELLRQLVVLLITRKEINILAVQMLLEFLNRLQVVGLDGKMKWVHQMRATQLIEVEELEVAVNDLLQRDVLVLANVLDVSEEFANAVGLILVQRVDEGPVLLRNVLLLVCNWHLRSALVCQRILLLDLSVEDEYLSNRTIVLHNEVDGVVLIFHASQGDGADVEDLFG